MTTTVQFEPLADQMVVQRLAPEPMGGILIPETVAQPSSYARVIACGPGSVGPAGYIPLAVQPGDTVLLGEHTGTEMTINGQDYLLVRAPLLLAVCADKN